MFNLLKNMFGAQDNTALEQAIKEGAYLVDVRTQGEYASGHVNGSVNIPLDALPHKLAKLKGKKQIVVFCQSGGRSSSAKSILEQNGFKNIINGGSWFNVDEVVNTISA